MVPKSIQIFGQKLVADLTSLFLFSLTIIFFSFFALSVSVFLMAEDEKAFLKMASNKTDCVDTSVNLIKNIQLLSHSLSVSLSHSLRGKKKTKKFNLMEEGQCHCVG